MLSVCLFVIACVANGSAACDCAPVGVSESDPPPTTVSMIDCLSWLPMGGDCAQEAVDCDFQSFEERAVSVWSTIGGAEPRSSSAVDPPLPIMLSLGYLLR